jgi:hypothetical protein
MNSAELSTPDALDFAPPDSWVALSLDETRIIAVGADPYEVEEKAKALGEPDYVLAKTPPSQGWFVF